MEGAVKIKDRTIEGSIGCLAGNRVEDREQRCFGERESYCVTGIGL